MNQVHRTKDRASLTLWLRLLAYVRPHRGQVALAVLASVVAAGAAAAWAALLGPLLESVLKGGDLTVGPFPVKEADVVTTLPLAIIGVALVKALSGTVHAGLMASVAQKVLTALRRALYEKLLALPPRWYETQHSGALLSRFTADVAQVEYAVGQALSSWAKDSLQLLALLGVCAAIDPRLFALTFVVLPGIALPVSRFAKSARKAATKTQASLGLLTALTAEQLHNLPVVQAYGTQRLALEAFDAEQARYLQVMKKSLLVRGAFSPTTEWLGILGVGAALMVGARAVSAEPALAGNLVSFLAAALLMYQPTKAISGTFSQVSQGVGAAQRLFEVLDTEVEADPGETCGPLSRGLELTDVRLTYGDGREALRGVTFTVPAGKTVALVGPSGAGKTSVISVLLGFVPAPRDASEGAAAAGGTRGEVRWDGAPLASLSRRSVREQTGWVPQEPVLLSGSVRDNLRLGRADASDEAMWRALDAAHAQDFVKAWPGGLDEPVGERGSRLSGGQRQRLAIARAFLREPSLLLLDEPTSALDAGTEAEVQAGLKALMAGRTTLVVAHRLATVQNADVIVVMDAGRVVEQGTHAQLLARGGLYARLARAAEAHAGVFEDTTRGG